MKKVLQSMQKFLGPSKASINLRDDAIRAAVLLDCRTYCLQHSITEVPPLEISKFKDEYQSLSKNHLAPHVEEQIRTQLIDMFENLKAHKPHPFNLEVGESSIPDAGQGVFVECSQDIVPGTIVALYPGRVYLKFELMDDKIVQSLMPDENMMLMLRRDDNLIDPRNLEGVPFNPFAFGHLINHCGASRHPNVYQLAFDFQDDVFGRKCLTFPKHLRDMIPNIYANEPSLVTKVGNLGHSMKGLVFMATRPIKNGDELLFDYRLTKSPALPWPAWYEPYSEEEPSNQE